MSVSPQRRVVVVGGGIAGMACAKELDATCEVTVVERSTHYHIPMPSTRAVVDATYAWQQFVPLKHALKKGKVLDNAATGMLLTEPTQPKVLCADGACLDADAVVIAIGARYMFPGEDDFSKPVGDRFKAYRAECAKLDANKSVLVVGGGPAGCELAAELKCFGEHDVTLVHSGTSLCSSQRGARPELGERCAAALKDLGIAVILDDRVAINAKQRSTRGAVTLKDGTIKTKKGVEIKATEAFWCGGNEYMGREVFDMLESSKSGQLVVDGGLRAGQARVWAAGEIAHAAGASEAAAMGRCAAKNVLAALAGKPPAAAYAPPADATIHLAFGPKRGLAQIAATPGCLGNKGGVFDSGPKANHKNALHSYCAKYWDDVGSQHMPEMRPF